MLAVEIMRGVSPPTPYLAALCVKCIFQKWMNSEEFVAGKAWSKQAGGANAPTLFTGSYWQSLMENCHKTALKGISYKAQIYLLINVKVLSTKCFMTRHIETLCLPHKYKMFHDTAY